MWLARLLCHRKWDTKTMAVFIWNCAKWNLKRFTQVIIEVHKFSRTFKLPPLTTNIPVCFHKQTKLGHLKWMWEESHIDLGQFAATQKSSQRFNRPIWLPKRIIVVPLLIVETNLPPITAGGGRKKNYGYRAKNLDLETCSILTFSTTFSVIMTRPHEP